MRAWLLSSGQTCLDNFEKQKQNAEVEAGKDIEHEKELMRREKRFAENLETVEFKRQVRPTD